MPKVIVSIDGVVIKEVQLTKDRTTLGRRPYNDVVIDNLAVSGEHAVLQMMGGEVYLEDLNSTNGSYINGKAIKKQLLQSEDVIEIGKDRIKFQRVLDITRNYLLFRYSGLATFREITITIPHLLFIQITVISTDSLKVNAIKSSLCGRGNCHTKNKKQ